MTTISNNAASAADLAARLKPLCDDIAAWEQNELKASNSKLHTLLQRAYVFYYSMAANRDWNTVLVEHLHKIGRPVSANTTLMGKVVRVLFDETRNNVTAYIAVLNTAKKYKVEEEKLATWIEDNGGIYAAVRKATDGGVGKQAVADDVQARAKARIANTKAALSVNADMIERDDLGKEQDGEYVLLLARKAGDQLKLLHSTTCKALVTDYLNKLGKQSPKLDDKQAADTAQEQAAMRAQMQAALAPAAASGAAGAATVADKAA